PQAIDRGLERSGLVGAEGVFGHHVAGHAVGSRATASAEALELAGGAAASEVVSLADPGEEVGGVPDLSQAGLAQVAREERQIRAGGDVPVGTDTEVVG